MEPSNSAAPSTPTQSTTAQTATAQSTSVTVHGGTYPLEALQHPVGQAALFKLGGGVLSGDQADFVRRALGCNDMHALIDFLAGNE